MRSAMGTRIETRSSTVASVFLFKPTTAGDGIHARRPGRASCWSRIPTAQIGIACYRICPRFAREVERIFRHTLHPGADFADRARAFHLSLGPSARRASHRSCCSADAGIRGTRRSRCSAPECCCGPHFLAAPLERVDPIAPRSTRGCADGGIWESRSSSCMRKHPELSGLQRTLAACATNSAKSAIEQWPERMEPRFLALLEAFGWPGDRALNSREYQIIEAWQRMLSEFAALDALFPAMTFETLSERLRELAAATLFQVENEGAPIQIMGLPEPPGCSSIISGSLACTMRLSLAPAARIPFLP